MNDHDASMPPPDADMTAARPDPGVASDFSDAEARASRALSALQTALADVRSAAEQESARRADAERELQSVIAGEREVRQELAHASESLRTAEAAAEEARQRAERSQADVVAIESELTEQKQVERELRAALESERSRLAATEEERVRLWGEVDRLSSALEQQRDALGRLLAEVPSTETESAPAAAPAPPPVLEPEMPAEPEIPAEPEPPAEPEVPVEPEVPAEPVMESTTRVAGQAPAETVEPEPAEPEAAEPQTIAAQPEPSTELPPPPPPPAEVTRIGQRPAVQPTTTTPIPSQPPPADIDALANACLGRSERSVVNRALQRLPGRLEQGETPMHLGVGDFQGTTILTAVTDRRVLLLKLDEELYQAFPYADVTGAEVSRERLGRASLRIASMHGDVVVKSRRPEMLERVQQHVRERIGGAQPVS